MGPKDIDFTNLEKALPEWQYFGLTSQDEAIERIAKNHVVVVQKALINERILNAAKSLKLICIAGTGVDNIDLEAAERHNIPVCNVRGYSTGALPQHVFALILNLATRILDYHNAVQEGRWERSKSFCFLDYPIRELAEMTLGIIGFGETGRAVARIAEGFGMNVLVSPRPGSAKQHSHVSLTELLERSDVVSIHCPLTEDTRNLIGQEQLSLMKKSAILINTARGGIIDEHALAQALREGLIGGAGIDVLSEEPPAQGNPLLSKDIPNLIVTPHVAWGSRIARQRAIDEVALNIRSFQQGKVRNQVNNTVIRRSLPEDMMNTFTTASF